MRVVLTGSSGRLGRSIFNALAANHAVTGIDRSPFSTTHLVGDFTDKSILQEALSGADAIIHCAALHAPHVGGTRLLAEAALSCGIRRFVFTSTTALYGHAVTPGQCCWIDELTVPQPKSIYHRTKLAAEHALETVAFTELQVRVLRMSRSFPEPADAMASYRLHRGIDIRDVAAAHAMALTNGGDQFQRHVISAGTPFKPEDCEGLATDAASVIRLRAPALAAEFDRRHWPLPKTIDRIYASASADRVLGWQSRFGYGEVLAQLDRESLEVLPAFSPINGRPE